MSWVRSPLMVCSFLALLSALSTLRAGPAAKSFEALHETSVLQVTPRTVAELDRVLNLTDDVWSHELGLFPIDVRVTPAQRAAIDASGIPYRVMIEDVGALIAAQQGAFAPRAAPPFGDFADFAGIVAYMNGLAAARPDLASVTSLGNSWESRPLWMIHVHAPGAPADRKAIIYHGGQHAREWITPTVPLYLADRLINGYDTDPAIRALLDRVSFYLVPVMNPDGYVYTWTTYRLWRKNRRNNGGGVYGVDLNRNWGYQWGGVGASTSPSNDTYRGPSAFSEPETTAMRNFIQAHTNIVAHIDFHCYSQLLLWPWGYTSDLSPDHAFFQEIGSNMVARMLGTHGVTYIGGPTFDTIYPASGISSDWTYGSEGIAGMGIELRDTGQYGFILPADQIIPVCEEQYASSLYLADRTSAPVLISYAGGPPFNFPPLQSNNVDITVLPGLEAVDTATPMLHYRFNSSDSFIDATMSPIGGNVYRATLPPRGCGSHVEMYVSAAGVSGGENREPLGAPLLYRSVPVADRVTVLSDNFETDQGWTVSNTAPISGAWTRVDPFGTSGTTQSENDNPAGTGTHCYVTGQGSGPGGSQNEADVDNGPTRLVSPLLNATGYAARLSYYRWFTCGNYDDQLLVEWSVNNGGSWTPLESVRQGPVNQWIQRTYGSPTAATLPNSAQVRLRFTAQDPGNTSTTEGGVDDVLVEVARCGFLLGDVNNDSIVSVTDIGDFVNVLLGINTSSDTRQRSDMNGDTVADADDIMPFIDSLF